MAEKDYGKFKVVELSDYTEQHRAERLKRIKSSRKAVKYRERVGIARDEAA